MPFQIPITVGRDNWFKPEKLTAHFVFSSKHKLKFDVNHEPKQSSQLFSPDRGSEKAFNECLGVSNVFPTAALVQAVVT